MDDAARSAFLAKIQKFLVESVPHNKALGMQIAELGDDHVRFTLPYDARFVGNPETGVLHGGVVTAYIDAVCGAAVLAALKGMRRVATLDLRIDYMKPAPPERSITCHARCYRTTRHVAFVRAEAYLDDAPSELIATAAGTFAIFEEPSAMAAAAAAEAKNK